VTTTVATTTNDALMQSGRLGPHVVVVAPSTAGPLLIAGAGAAVTRPYAASGLWEVVLRAAPGLGGRARPALGPVEVDIRHRRRDPPRRADTAVHLARLRGRGYALTLD
jgi:hypothetical protein